MTFKQRLPYYLGGLIIGVIIVTFIWDKKGTEFNYGPNSRVLKNISTKELIYSENAITYLNSSNIDTSYISKILKNGNVDLGNKIKLDSCFYKYSIQGRKELENITISVINCKTSAIIDNINMNKP